MQGWAIALIILATIAVLLVIAGIVVTIVLVVFFVLMNGEMSSSSEEGSSSDIVTSSSSEMTSSSAPEPFVCPTCPGNKIPMYIWSRMNHVEYGSIEEYEAVTSVSPFSKLLNASQPINFLCDTSFPNSIGYYAIDVKAFPSAVCSVDEPKNYFFDENVKAAYSDSMCGEEFKGYMFGYTSMTNEQNLSCCDLFPRYTVNDQFGQFIYDAPYKLTEAQTSDFETYGFAPLTGFNVPTDASCFPPY